MIAEKQLNRFNDALFKYLFAKEEHKFLTIDLLNAVFTASNMPLLDDFNFRDREQSPDNQLGKAVAFDIVGTCKDGTKINIEVQAAPQRDMVARTLYYRARLFTRELQRGEDYARLTKTICINFLDYHCLELSGLDDFHNSYELRNTKHTEHRLSELFSIHFIEMPKWERMRTKLETRFDPKALSRLEKWLYYFSAKVDAQKREDVVMGEPALQQARLLEQQFISDPKQFEAYEKSEEGLRLLRSAWNYALEEGAQTSRVKTARKLFAKGMSPGEVAELTDLKFEFVQQIAKEQL